MISKIVDLNQNQINAIFGGTTKETSLNRTAVAEVFLEMQENANNCNLTWSGLAWRIAEGIIVTGFLATIWYKWKTVAATPTKDNIEKKDK